MKTRVNEKVLNDFVFEISDDLLGKLLKTILDDKYALELLGIENQHLSFEQIRSKIVNKEVGDSNLQKALAYLLNEYDVFDDEYSIATQEISAEAYTNISKLFAISISDKFYCFFLQSDQPDQTEITCKPLEFVQGAIESMVARNELEAQNLKDEYFDDMDTSNELFINITF